jgi:hypothetical protein
MSSSPNGSRPPDDIDAEPIEPAERWYSQRGAAAACGVSRYLIRKKLEAGAFSSARALPNGAWQIPATDLEHAVLMPMTEWPDGDSAQAEWPDGDSAQVVGVSVRYAPDDSDRYRQHDAGRYAALLVDLSSSALQAERLRCQAEKWQMIAEERARCLARADVVMHTVARARESADALVQAAAIRAASATAAELRAVQLQARLETQAAARRPESVVATRLEKPAEAKLRWFDRPPGPARQNPTAASEGPRWLADTILPDSKRSRSRFK